jgi:hypothetical protein
LSGPISNTGQEYAEVTRKYRDRYAVMNNLTRPA